VRIPIRICLVSAFPPVKGGASSYTQNYVRAIETYLSREITEIHVLSHIEGKKAEKYENYGKIHVNRLFNSCTFLSRNFSFLKIFRKIMQIRPDIVHFEYGPNGEYGGLFGEPLLILFFLLKIIDIPFYVTLHSAWLPAQAQQRAYERTKNKLLSILAKYYFAFFMHFFGTMPQKLLIVVNKRGSKLTDNFSQAYHISRDHIKEELHGIWMITEQKQVKTKLVDKASKKIVCLGIMSPSKGYEFTIKAMKDVLKKFPESCLIIAGNADSEEGKKYIERLNCISAEYSLKESVIIEERYLTDTEFIKYVKTAGVIVLPYSRVVGASGIMHLAFQYKVPVIVAGSGVLFEELSDLVPVVPPMNPAALAEEIIKIFSRDSKSLEKYERYLSEHDWSIVARNIYDLYIQQSKRINYNI
jgi:glycosyltransferase involved in cell wall biosynthesis